jgi:CheY-like chemotaxis protein/HPt (histidine-containing phosphotransfer) domain-containing protein
VPFAAECLKLQKAATGGIIQTGHKVLVVDDDAVSLELMALLLAHEGHQVLRANDAGAALELLSSDQSARPDVLLVDLQMPGISGGQLAEKVRALGSPGPLLLAMSASEAQRQQLLAFDGFLLKPLAVDDFRRALKPKKRGRAPAARITHPGSKASVPPVQAVDMAVVSKLIKMMPKEAFNELFAACIADSRSSSHAIQSLVDQDDLSGVAPLAHRIKGAASMVGAVRLAWLAAGLEAGGSKPAATPAVLDDLLSACNELERMLLAGNLTETQGPHDHYDSSRNA